MRELRATISRLNPNVVLSFLVNANIMACLTRLGMCHKLMISEQTDPKSYALNEPWLTIRRLSYPVADHLVCVSRGVSDGFGWLPEERRTVIYNPINDSWFRSVFDFERPKVIGGMGRLIGRKGFNHLISAFSAIAERHPEWSLQIAGEGAERRNLEAQIASLGRVGDRIKLIGPVDDPPEFFSRIGIFVLPSLFEGFGNVLIEAMACGVPVVSFNCNFGPAEIIDDPEVGSLVAAGDVDALADEISSLIRNEKLRTKRAEAAYQSVLQRFSLNRIGGQWLDLCERLLAE
jgi:glycosyltransferase involved in cell wall biosynthesis